MKGDSIYFPYFSSVSIVAGVCFVANIWRWKQNDQNDRIVNDQSAASITTSYE